MFFDRSKASRTSVMIFSLLFLSTACKSRTFNSPDKPNDATQVQSISNKKYTIGLYQTREYVPGVAAFDFKICKEGKCELMFKNDTYPLLIVNLKFMEKNNIIKKNPEGKFDESVKIMISQKISDFINKWDRSTMSRFETNDFTSTWETCFDLLHSNMILKPTNFLCISAGFIAGVGAANLRIDNDDNMKAHAELLKTYFEQLIELDDGQKAFPVDDLIALNLVRAMLFVFDKWNIGDGLAQEWYTETTRNINYNGN